MRLKLFIIGLLVVVIVGVGIYARKNQSTQETGAPAAVTDQTPTQAEAQPKFVYGTVKSITGDTVVFTTTSDGDKTAKVVANTELVKQNKDDKNLITIVKAVLSDFKIGKQIFVYYENEPVNGVYQTKKLQLIN